MKRVDGIAVHAASDGTGLIVSIPNDEFDGGAEYFAPYTGGVWALSPAGVPQRQTRGTCDTRAPRYSRDAAVRRWVRREFVGGGA